MSRDQLDFGDDLADDCGHQRIISTIDLSMSKHTSTPSTARSSITDTRRDFLQKTGSAAAVGTAASTLAFPGVNFGQESDGKKLKIGLIGCGGRGTGAVAQAHKADDNCELWAMADLYEEKAILQLRQLGKSDRAAAMKVSDDLSSRIFGGLDAFEKVLDSGIDVALLTTPPGFRPQHYRAAIENGVHAFVEKPVATDVAGINHFNETSKMAKDKNLSVLSGLCYRYSDSGRELFTRIHDGAIGDVQSIHSQYLAGPVKVMPPAADRPAGMSDVEWQLKNWYNFAWLSGDGLVEQGIHNIDRCAWAMGDVPPVAAFGSGGRQRPNHEGNIYDHFSVTYQFPNNVHAHVEWRQFVDSYQFTGDTIYGTKGTAKFGHGYAEVTGENAWRWRKPRTPTNMYQIEHDEFFTSIRKGERHSDEDLAAQTTMLGLLGRTVCYTGKRITWDEIVASEQKLVPDGLDMSGDLPIRPMPIPGVAETQNA
jgi:predicted dehydrogenase